MRLKRLDLYGYKSFAPRVAFEFPQGITAIIGPNGSGKSNIADAIRWVTGEQSYRTLRAGSTSDMIFSGSRNRARLGMCEVLVTLDNSDGSLPIEYSEVTVGRRAYRSGDNEYLLNGNQVRYRDILNLLSSAGIASNAYTVIGQGMVDAALALRPQARRALFEEAAGIAPHLRKRNDALKRIAETERNLERVSDIINELKPRGKSLRRQAERAEEHALLSQDLQELQRIWYGYQWQRCRRDLARAEHQVAQWQAQLYAQRRRASSFGDGQEQLSRQLAEQRRMVEQHRNRETQVRRGAETLRRSLAVTVERERLYRQQTQTLDGDIQTLESRQGVLEQEIKNATEELHRQLELQEQSQGTLTTLRLELSAINAGRLERQQQLEAQQSHLNRILATISQNRARQEQEAEQQQQVSEQQRQAKERLVTLRSRRAELAAKAAALTQHEEACAARLSELEEKRRQIEGEIASSRRIIEDTENTLRRVRSEHDRLVSQRDLLARARKGLTGYHPGVRSVLLARQHLPGVLGTVASLMQVSSEIEQAIESALGARLQNIVTERWEDAERAIEHLKQTHSGWATFLPLDTVRPRPALKSRRESGIVGVACDLVRYDERLRPVFELLLGRTIVVRNLAVARRLLTERTGASLFVTLDGETVQPSGALSGGARQKNANLLAQEREWRQLPDEIARIEVTLEEAIGACQAAQDHLTELRRDLTTCETQARGAQIERQGAQEAVSRQIHDQRELERNEQWEQSRSEQASKQLQELARQARDTSQKLAKAEQEQAQTAGLVADLRQQISDARNERLQQSIAQMETRTAVAQRTVDSQQRLIKSHQQSMEQLATEMRSKRDRREELCRVIDDLRETGQTEREELSHTEGRAAAIQEEISSALKRIEELEVARGDAEKRYAQSLERLHKVEVEANQATLHRDRLKDRQTELIREIEGEIGPIELPEIVSQQLRLNLSDDIVELPTIGQLPQGLGEEVRHLRAHIRRIGAINPEAPQEYGALLDRQTFLESQSEDLCRAIAGLHEVIEELDEIIERDLGATITTVNKAFGEYFTALFNGGSARLVLTDPEHLSTTGVDIVAHPPGKRAQSLTLLSGGERSLTAVALLFALLRASPVPFCFLDEVDAALDEINVARFRDLLVERANAIQFIIITHNRHTIEAASTIYGVSMSEQGVSHSVSLQLEKQKQVSATA